MPTVLLTGFELAPRFIGEIALLTGAALFIGLLIAKVLPHHMSPQLFGALVPFMGLGAIAFLGSYSAATALMLFVVVALLALSLGST
jgi:uncharacterized membrane protein